ncbi:pseudouridine synthase [Aliagarivorans taiwanensis]|uniref:pseudouridine synthase n=1 Tax=Aliagarivorans taiwanensis TaxID=561966 RepID=UPI0004200EB5|nr:pseudouridine synthase [Aliagarivorans taiwanensis]
MSKTIRLDKFLAQSVGLTRSQAKQVIKSGSVLVDGIATKQAQHPISPDTLVSLNGKSLSAKQPRYIMMNKPAGVVSTEGDAHHPSATSLIEDALPGELHCAGRLDVDTTGLLLITDDGQWSHRVTSPRHNKSKRYRVSLADPIDQAALNTLAQGVLLRNENKPTLPATLEQLDPTEVLITISEGRYHQVKRMFAFVGNKVEALHREAIGDLVLPTALEPGDYCELTAEQIALF